MLGGERSKVICILFCIVNIYVYTVVQLLSKGIDYPDNDLIEYTVQVNL